MSVREYLTRKDEDENDFGVEPDEPTIEELYVALTEPSEGDFIMAPSGPLGRCIVVSVWGSGFTGEFADDDTAEAAIAKRMRREKFFPDVWTLSDHGNYECVSERFYSEHSSAIYGK